MKTHRIIIAIYLLLITSTALGGPDDINVVAGKYGDYYHLRYELTPENCEMSVSTVERMPKYTDSNAYTFSEGGQFEVFIRKGQFPIAAPHTDRDFLILRMPYTDLSNPNAARFIAEKRMLFDRIKKMKSEGRGKVEVIIELNPYCTVVKKQPLTIELSERNIFFRQAHDQCIDYLGPLRQNDNSTQDGRGGHDSAGAPSFDCSKASTGPERLICSSKELSAADMKLSIVYKVALERTTDKVGLKHEQRLWIINKRNVCSDVDSMLKAYNERINELERK